MVSFHASFSGLSREDAGFPFTAGNMPDSFVGRPGCPLFNEGFFHDYEEDEDGQADAVHHHAGPKQAERDPRVSQSLGPRENPQMESLEKHGKTVEAEQAHCSRLDHLPGRPFEQNRGVDEQQGMI
jgi:hypothetical protein